MSSLIAGSYQNESLLWEEAKQFNAIGARTLREFRASWEIEARSGCDESVSIWAAPGRLFAMTYGRFYSNVYRSAAAAWQATPGTLQPDISRQGSTEARKQGGARRLRLLRAPTLVAVRADTDGCGPQGASFPRAAELYCLANRSATAPHPAYHGTQIRPESGGAQVARTESHAEISTRNWSCE
jgi:hypothetical protein